MTSVVQPPRHRVHPAQRLVRRMAATRAGAWCLARALRRIDSAVLQLTRGRATFTSLAAGVPVITLTTTGARSGLSRRSVILGIPVGGGTLAVVAGDFGQPRPPAWAHNLLAHPEATVRARGRVDRVIARRVVGAEREAVLDAALAAYPAYATYATWIEGREMPVFILEPLNGGRVRA